MKVIRPIILFFSLCNYCFAASWTTTNCSSSDGAIKWELGTAHEGIKLRYSNFIEGTLELSPEEVNIDLFKTVVFSEELFKDQEVSAVKMVTVARARITASEKHPEILDSHFPGNQIEGDVLCTSVLVKEN